MKIGDVVKLKSGSPPMTVAAANGLKARCVWHPGGPSDFAEYEFPLDALDICATPNIAASEFFGCPPQLTAQSRIGSEVSWEVKQGIITSIRTGTLLGLEGNPPTFAKVQTAYDGVTQMVPIAAID